MVFGSALLPVDLRQRRGAATSPRVPHPAAEMARRFGNRAPRGAEDPDWIVRENRPYFFLLRHETGDTTFAPFLPDRLAGPVSMPSEAVPHHGDGPRRRMSWPEAPW